MPTTVTLPELGEGITAGDVLHILVKAGDTVAKDQPLLEIETDKAAAEVPSPHAGRILKVLAKPGAKLAVGAPILEIEPANALAPKSASPKPHPTPPSTAGKSADSPPNPDALSDTPEAVLLPALGEGIASGDVLNILVKEGDSVAKDQPLLEIETDKAAAEVPSPMAGVVVKILVKPGGKARVGEPILTLAPTATALSRPTPKARTGQAPAPSPETPVPAAPEKAKGPTPPAASRAEAVPRTGPVPPATRPHGGRAPFIAASPSIRRFARELGVDIALVQGSGPGGRVTQADVKRFVREGGFAAAAAAGPAAAAPLPDFSLWGEIERKPLPSLRRKIAEQMARAWTIPMVTQYDQADITALEEFRKRHAPAVKSAGGALTITPFVMKAVVAALRQFPQFNCSLDLGRGEIIQKQYIHLGIAVDTGAGLIVPVVRDVDKKSIRELALELAALAQRARDRKVGLDELRGASFTISNLGGIGGTAFTPLVNPPEVAILGVSRARVQPHWTGAAFEPRLLMPLSVTYDHRAIDGADGARFTRRVAEGIEDFGAAILDAPAG